MSTASKNLTRQQRDFIRRWNEKASKYDLHAEKHDEKLANHFDRFISRYVVYNVLYNHVCRNLAKWESFERNRATDCIVNELGQAEILSQLGSLKASVLALLKSETFVVIDRAKDKTDLIDPMDCGNQFEQAKALLLFLYNVRCNTLHGDKSFEAHQMVILRPCIEMTERLNDMLIDNIGIMPQE
jgi:hypothetical protein